MRAVEHVDRVEPVLAVDPTARNDRAARHVELALRRGAGSFDVEVIDRRILGDDPPRVGDRQAGGDQSAQDHRVDADGEVVDRAVRGIDVGKRFHRVAAHVDRRAAGDVDVAGPCDVVEELRRSARLHFEVDESRASGGQDAAFEYGSGDERIILRPHRTRAHHRVLDRRALVERIEDAARDGRAGGGCPGLDVGFAVFDLEIGREVGRAAHDHRAARGGRAVEQRAAVRLDRLQITAVRDCAFDGPVGHGVERAAVDGRVDDPARNAGAQVAARIDGDAGRESSVALHSRRTAVGGKVGRRTAYHVEDAAPGHLDLRPRRAQLQIGQTARDLEVGDAVGRVVDLHRAAVNGGVVEPRLAVAGVDDAAVEGDVFDLGAVVGAQGAVHDRHLRRRRAGLDVDRAVEQRGAGGAVGRVAHDHRTAVDRGAVEGDVAVGLCGVEAPRADDRAFDERAVVGADVAAGEIELAQRTRVDDDVGVPRRAARDREIDEFRARADADRAARLLRAGGFGVEVDPVQPARDRRVGAAGALVQHEQRAARDRHLVRRCARLDVGLAVFDPEVGGFVGRAAHHHHAVGARDGRAVDERAAARLDGVERAAVHDRAFDGPGGDGAKLTAVDGRIGDLARDAGAQVAARVDGDAGSGGPRSLNASRTAVGDDVGRRAAHDEQDAAARDFDIRPRRALLDVRVAAVRLETGDGVGHAVHYHRAAVDRDVFEGHAAVGVGRLKRTAVLDHVLDHRAGGGAQGAAVDRRADDPPVRVRADVAGREGDVGHERPVLHPELAAVDRDVRRRRVAVVVNDQLTARHRRAGGRTAVLDVGDTRCDG